MTAPPASPASPAQLRALAAAGEWTTPTAGILDGFQQANLVIVPHSLAFEFLLYCTRNPKPCPVIAVTDPGDPVLRFGTTEADLRTTLPRYRVWRDGQLVAEPTDITPYWQDDAVAFLLGCSHTFEGPLRSAGIPIAHAAPPVYTTNIATTPAGPFSGPLLVSMRAVPGHLAATAVETTSRYPTGHGTPVHIGDPSVIGITSLSTPDFGPPPTIPPNSTPMFWACGVTPQQAISSPDIPYAITHYPGHMFVFDHTP